MNNPFKNFNAKINGRQVKSHKEFIDTLQEEINKVTYVPSDAVCENETTCETACDENNDETTCENVDMSNIDNIKERIEHLDIEIDRTNDKFDEMKHIAETLRSEHSAILDEIVLLQALRETLIKEKVEAVFELHDAVKHNLSILNKRLEREETIIDSLSDEQITKLYESVDSLMNIFTSLTKTGTN